MAGDHLGGDLALGRGDVGQGQLAGDIADGVDAGDVGLQLVVDHDEAALGRDAEVLQAEVLAVRQEAGGEQDALDLDRLRFALALLVVSLLHALGIPVGLTCTVWPPGTGERRTATLSPLTSAPSTLVSVMILMPRRVNALASSALISSSSSGMTRGRNSTTVTSQP